MSYDEIKKLINEMETANINELNLEFPDGVKISMKKDIKEEINKKANTVCKTQNGIQSAMQTPMIKKETEKLINNEKIENNIKIIKSPMVGTFYESSTPNSKPFVQIGDKVKKGQIICIVEAMKLMNEIESEFDGEITQICVNNEAVVEYGMPLFKIK